MKLIVGLGNPGKQYEGTRHNAGFIAIDEVAKHYGAEFKLESKLKGMVAKINSNGNKAILLKPMTYMNLSGESVVATAQFYKIPLEDIVIICDDLDTKIGTYRLRYKGSSGGHNGIKDIIEVFGRDDFPRIKIGVGSKPHPDYDLKDWVLGGIPKDEQEALKKAMENTVCAVEEMLKNGIDSAMNKYNGEVWSLSALAQHFTGKDSD